MMELIYKHGIFSINDVLSTAEERTLINNSIKLLFEASEDSETSLDQLAKYADHFKIDITTYNKENKSFAEKFIENFPSHLNSDKIQTYLNKFKIVKL